MRDLCRACVLLAPAMASHRCLRLKQEAGKNVQGLQAAAKALGQRMTALKELEDAEPKLGKKQKRKIVYLKKQAAG